ncbi:hypothetical protein pb186bvf_019835 [Paramecium bursaria]
MAFVYKAERDLTQKLNDLPPNLGPGAYKVDRGHESRPHVVPFNTQVLRSKPLKKDSSPGPGSYNTEFHQEGQKVVLQSGQSEVKILEIPKQQAIFQSKTKRFIDQRNLEIPGPGAYEADPPTKPLPQYYSQQNTLEQLFKLNKYQSIPSIPSNGQSYGYTEKGNNDLQIMKNPVQSFTGLKSDTVGPGQYQLKDTFDANKKKGPTWFKSKVSRLAPAVPKDKELQVGPGAYDHEGQIIPIYKLNPSSGFQSKSQRIFDQQRGSKAREFLKQQFDSQKKKLMQTPGFADIPDDDLVEFIDDATPGPGHYFANKSHNQSTASTASMSAPRLGQAVFGSKQKRFQEQQQQIVVGPGDYEVHPRPLIYDQQYKKPPFLTSNTRFETKVLEKNPGPQAYDPKTTLHYNLSKKLERAPLGKFGSNEPRFEVKEQEVPGPGYYDQKLIDERRAAAAVFKSQSKRVMVPEPKDQFPAPGSYDVKNFTIEQATRVELEEDKDLRVEKPAFGVAVERFPNTRKDAIDEEEDEKSTILHNKSQDKFRKERKEHPPFNAHVFIYTIKDKRFNYDVKNPVPGPGEYFDPKTNPWDKKTFNILFSEI